MHHSRTLALLGALVAALALPTATATADAVVSPVAALPSGSGSAIGPGGDLFVASPADGTVYRIDRHTHEVSSYATGLPTPVFPLGGVMDVAFLGSTAYALVTLVGPEVGGTDVDGLYRIDGPTSATPVADIGAWSVAHPPETDYFVPSGLQYALQPFRGGFLVTDGHHNRVLDVGLDGSVTELTALANVVPTGLDTWGATVLVAEAGPVPHAPADGRVVTVDAETGSVTGVLAAGAPLLVDVERGRGSSVYALAQGDFPGGDPGSPASPGTGSLVRALADGGFATVTGGLDRPTSLEVQDATAFIVSLDGEVVAVDLGR